MAKSIGNMGLAYATVLNYNEALKCYEQSLDMNKQIGDKSGIAAVFWFLLDMFIQTHQILY